MANFRRFIPSIVAFLVQVALQLAGYQSALLAIALSVLIVVLAVMGGWPWLKRWRPFTLAPAGDSSRDASGYRDSETTQNPSVVSLAAERIPANERQLREENEQKQAEIDALKKALEEARSAADKTAKDTMPTDRVERSTAATPAETPTTPVSVSASSNPVLGKTVSLTSGARVTVHGYEAPIPPPSWFQNLSPGHELLAIDVEAHAGSNPEDYLDHFQQSDFKLQMPDSTRLRPALAAKEPALLNNPLAPNDDIRGWITFEVPKGEKPKFVVYSKRRSVIKWTNPQQLS